MDFSAVGIERARAQPGADGVEWVVDDVRTWTPPPGQTYDLVLVVYLHLADDDFRRATSWLDPGGALSSSASTRNRATVSVGRRPRLLYTVVGFGRQDRTLLTVAIRRAASSGGRHDLLHDRAVGTRRERRCRRRASANRPDCWLRDVFVTDRADHVGEPGRSLSRCRGDVVAAIMRVRTRPQARRAAARAPNRVSWSARQLRPR